MPGVCLFQHKQRVSRTWEDESLWLSVFGDIYPWGILMCASLLMAIPVTAVYIYTQRYAVESLTAGSVKG